MCCYCTVLHSLSDNSIHVWLSLLTFFLFLGDVPKGKWPCIQANKNHGRLHLTTAGGPWGSVGVMSNYGNRWELMFEARDALWESRQGSFQHQIRGGIWFRGSSGVISAVSSLYGSPTSTTKGFLLQQPRRFSVGFLSRLDLKRFYSSRGKVSHDLMGSSTMVILNEAT